MAAAASSLFGQGSATESKLAEAPDIYRANGLAEQGSFAPAVVMAFEALRDGRDETLRRQARELLVNWGLKPDEVFRLKAPGLPREELEAVAEKLSALRARRLRWEAEWDRAERLLRAAVVFQWSPGEKLKVVAPPRELARAVWVYLDLALAEGGGMEAAQNVLETWRCGGAQAQALRTGLAGGQLPESVQREAIARVLVQRMGELRYWATQNENSPDWRARKRLAQELGPLHYQLLAEQYADCAAPKQDPDNVDYWRNLTTAKAPEKF